MNKEYLDKYLNYYSGENRKAMFLVFAKLIDAIRSDELDQLKEILTDDCIADYSTCGSVKGISNIIEMLKWPGPDCQVRKSTIWNFVARSNKEGKGQQCAYIQSVNAIDDGTNIFPFTFGGRYCNSYVKTKEGWKISHIRFDLVYADGNTCFVEGKWKLIEGDRHSGHVPMIMAELDNPWDVIKDDCEPQSDVEQIFELQFKKAFGLDTGDFRETMSVMTEDMQQFHEEKGIRNCINFLKYKNHKESSMQHANRMGSVCIEGDHATAMMPRSEEHRLRDRVYSRENIHSMVTTGAHKLFARKIDGEWKLYRIDFGYVPKDEFRFIPMKDDVISYDEYVLGRRCDENEDFN